MLDDALEKHRQGDFPGAEAIYQQLLDDEPDNHELLHLFALLRQDQGQLDEAHDMLSKAIELKPEAATFHASLGSVLQARGDLDGARDSLTKALELNSNLVQAHLAIGYLHMVKGDLKESEQSFQTVLKMEPESVPAMLNMANLHLLDGQVDRAVAFAQQAVDRKPNETVVQTTLGRAMAAQGHAAFAEQCFRNALKIRPDYAVAKTELARVLTTQDKADDAARLLQEVLADDSNNIAALDALGDVALAKSGYSQAIQNYQYALTLDRDRADILGKLGQAYLASGDSANALRCLDVALERGFNAVQVHVSRGDALSAQGRPEDALAAYRSALESDATDVGAWHGYCRLLIESGRIEAALDELIGAIPAQDRSGPINTLLSRLFTLAGKPGEALAALQQAVKQENADPGAVNQLLGQANHHLGHYEDAAAAFAAHAEVRDRSFAGFEDSRRIAGLRAEAVPDDSKAPVFLLGPDELGLQQWLSYLRASDSIDVVDDRMGGVNRRQDFLAQPESFLALTGVPEATIRLSRKRYWRALERLRDGSSRPMVDVIPVSMQLLRLIALVFPNAQVVLLSGDTGDLALQAHVEGCQPTTAAAYAQSYAKLVADAQVLPIRCLTLGPPANADLAAGTAELSTLLGVPITAEILPSASLTAPTLLPTGSAEHYRSLIPALFETNVGASE